MPLIVDAHEDLAWNALTFGRDYSRAAHHTRDLERDTPVPGHNGNTLLGLPDYLRGGVAVVFGTLYAAPARFKFGEWDKLYYKDAAQAHALYARQLDYYERLADEHPQFRLINTQRDLEQVLGSWPAEAAGSAPPADPGPDPRRVGIVRLMEGADGIRQPKEIEWWVERGVRIVGLAWAGTRYAGGTGEPGPLSLDGRRLLAEMAPQGTILDLSHASDESFLEAAERYEGTLIASHANPRALLKDPPRPERYLSDGMIQVLAERGGVVGVVPYNRFLKPDWRPEDPRQDVSLDRVLDMIDHICQLTGSAGHAGIGSDFDGGFGVEKTPAEIDTVADLGQIASRLKGRGYAGPDVEKILSGNWLRILRQGLPE
jgi:membrane dipeptidase